MPFYALCLIDVILVATQLPSNLSHACGQAILPSVKSASDPFHQLFNDLLISQ